MPIFTDAIVNDVSVTIADGTGRSLSISFEEAGLLFHKSRPLQGRKALVPYEELFDLALTKNPRLFNKPVSRKRM